MSDTSMFSQEDKEKKPLVRQRNRIKQTLDERGMIDMPFLILTIILVCIGIIMMFSASYASAYSEGNASTHYFKRQVGIALVGFLFLFFFAKIFHYGLLYTWSRMIFWVSALLMLLVVIIGLTAGGAKRWIYLFGFNFQPSEVAKLAVIIQFSAMLSSSKKDINDLRNLKPYIGYLAVMLGLLFLQSHLSASIIIALVAASLLFVGGLRMRWYIGAAALAFLAIFLYLKIRPYAGDRIDAWLNPWEDPKDKGFQIIQSLYAIGSGGLMGQGLGRSRQKYLYLPEEHNDYIFPIVCEELGFVGAVLIILLFVLLILRGYWIAIHAKDRFGAFLAGGITTLLALQVFLNIGVVTNFLPSTGISLPFFSYGGTALLMQLAEMGIVLGVSRKSDSQLLS